MILTSQDVIALRAMMETSAHKAERRMSDKDSSRYDRFTPVNWFSRLPIIPQEETPPASGYGYTQSPYISQWTKMWGVNPLTDLPKYRMMYRTVPIIKKAVDKTVSTAISKGFELDLPPETEHREDILAYLKSWIDQQGDFKIHLQMLASDALTYGNAYAEIVYDEINVTEEHSTDTEFQRVEIPDPHEDYKIGEHGIPYLPTVSYNGDGKYLKVAAMGNPVWIKPLDPLWMRVRRDSYGNVFGYLQYLSTPPVAFTNDKTIHIRFNPKSWWVENAYGCIWESELIYSPNGLKKVSDISEGDKIYTFNNGGVEETIVEKLIDNGIQNSYELQTKHRSLIATDIHPFLMEDGTWKQLKDIKIGDKITTVRNSGNPKKEIEFIIPIIKSRRPENLKNDIILPLHVTKELARLWGFMLGDGWISNHGNDNRVVFAKSKYDDQNKKYVSLINQIFNLNMTCYNSVNHQYIGTSKEVCEFFIANGWINGALYKVVPSWIFESSDEIKIEFIEGFIDADGYRYKNEKRVDIEIINQPLLKDIKLLVDSLGFKSGQVRLKSRKVSDKYIGERKIKSILPTFILTFSYNKFKESSLIIEAVKSIEYAGKRHVYDIAVKGNSHNFIVNGIVAHNTSMLMSLIRTQEAIWTIENDLILISHACAKPPLIFSCGDNTEEPWTEAQFTAFVGATSARGPGGDIYHRGDVESKPLPFPASSLAPLLAHLDYHVEQRMISLGVPPDLLGVHASSNRSVATVSFDDWINTIQLLQQQMGDAIQEQLFKPIIEKAFGEGCPIPSMVWNQVYEKDDAAEIQKVMTLRASNIITTNEARAWLGEVGKKLEPVTNGDSLLPPQSFVPTDEEKEAEDRMPSEDAILGDNGEPISEHKAEEEYMDVKIKKPLIYKPEKEEVLEAEVQGFSEPGTPSSTGMKDISIYPLLDRDGDKRRKIPILKKKDRKEFLSKVASKLQTMEFAPIRAEQEKLTGQSSDPADYSNEEPVKDLTNVKIKKLDTQDGVDVWVVSGDKVAARYSKDWKHSDSNGVHDYIGGHHYVFDYIPENEVWVSDLDERPEKTSLHELVERKAMKEGGMTYADAHLEALKAEGCNDTDIKRREYLQPSEVKTTFTRLYPKIEEKENTWQLGDKIISFDEYAGIIYVHEDNKITDQLLVRSSEDIEKFVERHR
jgi:intein/homing endonuclease